LPVAQPATQPVIQPGAQPVSQSVAQPGVNATSPRPDASRRMSLPSHVLGQHVQQTGDNQQSLQSSRSSTVQGFQQKSVSPQRLPALPSTSPSGHTTSLPKSSHTTPTSVQFPSLPFSSQVIDTNPLSLALPPEAQQFVGFALDPNDSRTAMLMAGSENLAQPFLGTYTYNPNLSPKAARSGCVDDQSKNFSTSVMTETLAPDHPIKLETLIETPISNSPSSAVMENLYTPEAFFTPGFECSSFFDQYQTPDGLRTSNDGTINESYEENSFVNWDQ
jgi:hypothetical protein